MVIRQQAKVPQRAQARRAGKEAASATQAGELTPQQKAQALLVGAFEAAAPFIIAERPKKSPKEEALAEAKREAFGNLQAVMIGLVGGGSEAHWGLLLRMNDVQRRPEPKRLLVIEAFEVALRSTDTENRANNLRGQLMEINYRFRKASPARLDAALAKPGKRKAPAIAAPFSVECNAFGDGEYDAAAGNDPVDLAKRAYEAAKRELRDRALRTTARPKKRKKVPAKS